MYFGLASSLVDPLILTATVASAVLSSAAIAGTVTTVAAILLAAMATYGRFHILKFLKLLQDVDRYSQLFLSKLSLLMDPMLVPAHPGPLLFLFCLVEVRIRFVMGM